MPRWSAVAMLVVTALAAATPARAEHPATTWALQTIEADRLKAALDRKQPVVVVDLRSPEEFRQGHIPGARSLSLDESGEKFRQLPRREPIVLYCGCPVSEIGAAYQFLRYSGYTNVFVLHGGVAEWQARGYALEK